MNKNTTEHDAPEARIGGRCINTLATRISKSPDADCAPGVLLIRMGCLLCAVHDPCQSAKQTATTAWIRHPRSITIF